MEKQKYLPLPKEFIKKGFVHIWVQDLDNDEWKIYRRFKKDSNCAHFELIKSKKQKAFLIGGGVTIEAKIVYPNSESWGNDGFTYSTLNECINKYEKIKGQKKI